MNTDEFVHVLKACISNNEQIRRQAEDAIEGAKKKDPNTLMQLIVQTIRANEEADVRLQSALLLRNAMKYPIGSHQAFGQEVKSQTQDQQPPVQDIYVWELLSGELKSMVQSELLQAMEQEQNKRVLMNVCDTVAELAAHLAPKGGWPSLIDQLLQLLRSTLPRHVVAGLHVLSEVVNYFDLTNYWQAFVLFFPLFLQSQEEEIRLECTVLLVALIEDRIEVVLSKLKINGMLTGSLKEFMKSGSATGEYENCIKFMEIISRIADGESGRGISYLKNDFTEMVFILIQMIMHEEAIEDEQVEQCKKHAIEILLTICEKKPLFASKVRNFVDELVGSLLFGMLDVRKEKYETWLKVGEETDEGENRLFDCAEEGVDRVARAFNGHEEFEIIDKLFHQIKDYVYHEEWAHKFVGIMALAQCVEYISEDKLEESVEDIVNLISSHMRHSDYRVRFASCHTLGQLGLDQQPYVQETYAEHILPLLMATLDDTVSVVQTHGCAALVNFTEEVDKNTLQPFADPLIAKLIKLLHVNTDNRRLQEHCVTSLAVMAGVLEDDYLPYYGKTMSIMMDILNNHNKATDTVFCGKAIECISIMGLSMRNDYFIPDGQRTMDFLIGILYTDRDKNDDKKDGNNDPNYGHNKNEDTIVSSVVHSPEVMKAYANSDHFREYAEEAVCRLCRCLKGTFLPYMTHIGPYLLKSLAHRPKELGVTEYDPATDDDLTYLLIEGGKSLGLKTSLLEEQERALDLITVFCEALLDRASEYVEPFFVAVLPMLDHQLSDDIKQKAIDAMARIIESTRAYYDSCKDGMVKAKLFSMLGTVSEKVLNNLADANQSQNACISSSYVADMNAYILEDMSAQASGLSDCFFKAKGGILSPEAVSKTTEKLFETLLISSRRKATLEERKTTMSLDDDDKKILGDIEKEEQEVRSSLLHILGSLMKFHRAEFLSSGSMDTTIGFVQQCFQSEAQLHDKYIGAFVCADIYEHMGEDGISFWPIFTDQIISLLSIQDNSLIQVCSFGINNAADYMAFGQWSQQAAIALSMLIRNYYNRRHTEVDTFACDNAVAALGKIVRIHQSTLNLQSAQEYLALWFDYLPLRADETEGVKVHTDLMNMAKMNVPVIVGPNNENVPRLINIFAKIYRTPHSSKELDADIQNMIQALGTEYLNTRSDKFTEKTKKKLKRICRDAIAAGKTAPTE